MTAGGALVGLSEPSSRSVSPSGDDPDVEALLRIAVVWSIPVACNRASADFMISSPLMSSEYERSKPDYKTHIDRYLPPG